MDYLIISIEEVALAILCTACMLLKSGNRGLFAVDSMCLSAFSFT